MYWPMFFARVGTPEGLQPACRIRENTSDTNPFIVSHQMADAIVPTNAEGLMGPTVIQST